MRQNKSSATIRSCDKKPSTDTTRQKCLRNPPFHNAKNYSVKIGIETNKSIQSVSCKMQSESLITTAQGSNKKNLAPCAFNTSIIYQILLFVNRKNTVCAALTASIFVENRRNSHFARQQTRPTKKNKFFAVLSCKKKKDLV